MIEADWIRVDEQFPDTEYGEYILIAYVRDGKPVVEIGYVCGEKLIKGSSERYPYPSHWIRLPKAPADVDLCFPSKAPIE